MSKLITLENLHRFKDNLYDSLSGVNISHKTSYVINQARNSDGSWKSPKAMIEKDIESMNDLSTMYIDGKSVYKDAIRRIRANTHLYVGRVINGILNCKQISDTDKRRFLDGTPVILGDDDNVYMKLPKFWWKCEHTLDTENNIDEATITFITDEEFNDGTYNEWSGDTFIGVYEGYVDENEKLRSIPNVAPTVTKSWTDFTKYSRNTSSSHSLITYESHCIMAILGYGWLGTTDAQSVVGKGTSTFPKTTGLCDDKGMRDSSAAGDGNYTSINFWGLENWWGDVSEWIDNLKTAGSYNINVLKNDLTTIYRTINTNLVGNQHEIKQMVLGSKCDLFPKLIESNNNYNLSYADYGSVLSASGIVAVRSGHSAYLGDGLALLRLSSSVSFAYADIGSRLQYKGEYDIVNSFN